MKLSLPGLCLLSLWLIACTHINDVFMMKRDEVLDRYASAIRWSNFEKAAEFQDPAHRVRLDLAWLKNIHVATYSQINLKDAPSSNVVEQTVEIRYFNEQERAEKTIIDRQIWRYDDDAGKWMLESDLPAFR